MPVGVFKVRGEHDFNVRWSLGLEFKCALWVESGLRISQDQEMTKPRLLTE